jgi:predicted small lipoprotein YifL
MTPRTRPAALAGAALVALTALAACGGGAKTPEYANDADTGAAAPATQQTLSPNPSMGDSTVGMSRGTGVGNMAGDTTGAFGKAAGTRQPAPGVPASGPAGSGMANQAKGAPQTSTPPTAKPLPATP